MNNQEKPLVPCPECGGQRYCARNKSIEINNNLGFTGGPYLTCNVVICSSCGYTTLYASNPMEQIARIEESVRKDLERHRKRAVAEAEWEAKRKWGFFRWY